MVTLWQISNSAKTNEQVVLTVEFFVQNKIQFFIYSNSDQKPQFRLKSANKYCFNRVQSILYLYFQKIFK